MEGLEISEVKLSEVLVDNETFRFDSEYFKKEYLNFIKNVPNTMPLEYFVKDGYRVVYENTKSIPQNEAINKKYPYFLQATDIQTPFVSQENLIYVSDEDWMRYPKGRIKPGELLIEVKGKLDKVSIVPNNFPKYTLVSGSLFKISVNVNINKHTLLTYLISKYGVSFKERFKTNLLISYISKPDLYKIPVPVFSKNFNESINYLYELLFDKDNISKSLYTQAEQLLLEELGLKDWKPSDEQTNIKSFKDSFMSTGRLDAEYYQPKYEELIQHLVKYETESLGRIVDIKKSIEPGSEAYRESGIPFVRVSNISKYGITKTDIHLDRNEYQSYELKPKKDTILLSKDGSVGIAYKVEKDLDIITSGALLHLNVIDNEFLSDYLTLVLNSVVVKLQSERDAGGSIIQHWKPSEIEQVVIPKLPKPIQQQIADNIQESFRLKQQSDQLLEVAKRAVEIAIEQNEDAAIAYINQNTIE